jgi:hypothetical protein
MKELIEVFRMNEVSIETRCKIIIQLGNAVNMELGMNITEPLVYELVFALDPNNEEIKKDHYKKNQHRQQTFKPNR